MYNYFEFGSVVQEEMSLKDFSYLELWYPLVWWSRTICAIESQEVSPFPAGDHKAHINRRTQNIANTRQNKNIKDPQKKYRLGTVSKIFYWRA